MQCDENLGLGGICKLIFPGWSWVTWHMRLWEDLWSSVFWCGEMQQGMILHNWAKIVKGGKWRKTKFCDKSFNIGPKLIMKTTFIEILYF